ANTEIKLKSAWQRRSLAMDLANLASFQVIESWVQYLFLQLVKDQPRGRDDSLAATAYNALHLRKEPPHAWSMWHNSSNWFSVRAQGWLCDLATAAQGSQTHDFCFCGKRMTRAPFTEEVDMSFLEGPFDSEQEVTDHLGHSDWAVIRRFVLVQGSEMKLRPIDDCLEDVDYVAGMALKIAEADADAAASFLLDLLGWRHARTGPKGLPFRYTFDVLGATLDLNETAAGVIT
ncbi:unnamed protein product, partial [Effrenium voratum]